MYQNVKMGFLLSHFWSWPQKAEGKKKWYFFLNSKVRCYTYTVFAKEVATNLFFQFYSIKGLMLNR